MTDWKVGDRVRIVDGSTAHNDTGSIYLTPVQPNGTIIVELDPECCDGEEGTLWPVLSWKIEKI